MSAFGAIVLAAGSSSRLGQPKQFLPHANGTLLENAVIAAEIAGCKPIVVVTGAVTGLLNETFRDRAILRFNSKWASGMGGSISVGISALLEHEPEMQRCFILLCDQPHLNATVLRDLASTWLASRLPMAACRYSHSVGPPCGFDRSYFNSLRELPEDRGAKSLLRPESSVAVLDWPDGAIDIDTPQDLQRWKSG